MSTQITEPEIHARWIYHKDGWAARLLEPAYEYDYNDYSGDLRDFVFGDDGYCRIPYHRIGAGCPVKMHNKDGSTSVRYINEKLAPYTFSVVDSPDNADCIRRGRHLKIRNHTYMEEWVRVYEVICEHCDARHTTGTYDEVEHAEAAYEFEDWADHPELGTRQYDTPRMWDTD